MKCATVAKKDLLPRTSSFNSLAPHPTQSPVATTDGAQTHHCVAHCSSIAEKCLPIARNLFHTHTTMQFKSDCTVYMLCDRYQAMCCYVIFIIRTE